MTLQSRIEDIVDKHLAHRNPADLQCREQLVQSLLAVMSE